jgi:SAM-dependent methyltransferase
MELRELQANWDALGTTDPFWAILSVPELKGGGWDVEQFLATGVANVERVMSDVRLLRAGLRHGAALDFGCGVGRLTQPLCSYFDRCVGVDIAPSMIELARSMNRNGPRCEYHLNETEDLSRYADQSFDFILSFIVLQHMLPQYSRRYIAEFLRLLRPGGVAVFQVPSSLRPEFAPAAPAPSVRRRSPLSAVRRAPRYLGRAVARYLGRPPTEKMGESVGAQIEPRIEMHQLDSTEVAQIVQRGGGQILDAREDDWAGNEWVSITYTVGR